MEQTVKWHYIADEGMPILWDNKPKLFLICHRVQLGERYEINGRPFVMPTEEYADVSTIALIQKHESKDGFAYTPSMKFYWGPDIFEDAYAWAEIPHAVPFKEVPKKKKKKKL